MEVSVSGLLLKSMQYQTEVLDYIIFIVLSHTDYPSEKKPDSLPVQ